MALYIFALCCLCLFCNKCITRLVFNSLFMFGLCRKYFQKKYFENNKVLEKSILKIQNKILFCIFKIKYYFENSILHITDD